MKRLLIGLVIVATALMAAIAFAHDSPEAEALKYYVGTWESNAVFKPSKWFPEGKRWVESNNIQLILDGHLLRIESYSDVGQSLAIQRYNEKTERYERWDIDASGDSSYWVGTADEESMSVTWKYVDFGAGFTGTVVDQSTGEGRSTTSVLLKDVHGNLLLDGQIERRRTEQPSKGQKQ